MTQTIAAGNTTLEEYTAGIEAVGRGHRLTSNLPDGGVRLANPLLHAADYYCLGTDNVNLHNYEATTPHFPIKWRKGVTPRGHAEVLINWRIPPGGGERGWNEIFSHGPLRIYRRQPDQ